MKSIRINTPADNTRRINENQIRIKIRIHLLTAGIMSCRNPAYLYPPWPPGRQHIVNHKGGSPAASHVAKLLALSDTMTTDIDRVQLRVVTKAHRHNMRLP